MKQLLLDAGTQFTRAGPSRFDARVPAFGRQKKEGRRLAGPPIPVEFCS